MADPSADKLKSKLRLRRTGRKRRLTGWTLIALGLLVAVVWGTSRNYRYLSEQGEWAVIIHEGRVEFTYRGSYKRAGNAIERLGNAWRWRARSGSELAMTQADCFQADLGFISYSESPLRHPATGRFVSAGFKLWSLILWPIPLLLWAAGVPVLRSGIVARRRAMTGSCGKCGYSLTGLGKGAGCPECGTVRSAAERMNAGSEAVRSNGPPQSSDGGMM